MKKVDNMSGVAIATQNARLQATVTKEEKEVIDALAAADDRTSSNFVGRIVREWLKDHNLHPDK